MSNTLEDRKADIRLRILYAIDSQITNDELERLVNSLDNLLLIEAHKIGLEAIGPNYIDLEDDTDPHTEITLKWMNFEKSQERARLSKITGVRE